MNSSTELHQKLESLLKDLLSQGGDYLSEEDRPRIERYIYHKEYFLALQDYCFGVIKERRRLPERATKIVVELMQLMGINSEKDDDFWLWEEFSESISIQKMNPRANQ